MAASVVASNTYVFADGDPSHTIDLGSSPTVGDVDVLCVNSNTTVGTPTGFTAAVSRVANQGAYVFYRIAAGGEGSTVAIATAGDFNTFAGWVRLRNTLAADDAKGSGVTGSAANTSPAHSTNALSASGEAVIAFSANHSIGAADQSAPSWSAGYTGLLAAIQGSGGTGVTGVVGYRLDGSGTESPTVTWSGDPASNRDMLTLTFTAAASPATTTIRRRAVAAYLRGTEGRLNDIMTVLGTTAPSLWPFWEATGIVVTDIAAGTLVPSETAAAAEQLEDDFSPVLLPCGLYSYHFDPTGDHHLAGTDTADYSFGNGSVDSPFSVGAWIRPSALTTKVIMGKYDSAGNLEEWRFFLDSADKLSLELHDASASATEIAISDSAMTVGQWVFVVATYDGGETAPVVTLYVDAVAVNDGSTTETGSYVAMENTAAPLTIGCSGVTALPVAEFHGRIAMPFLTGKALTAAEVTTLYGYTADDGPRLMAGLLPLSRVAVCRNPACLAGGVPRRFFLRVLAPGVVEMPRLVCQVCWDEWPTARRKRWQKLLSMVDRPTRLAVGSSRRNPRSC